jgi:hypothetical protein
MGALMMDRAARYVELVERDSATLEELSQRMAEGEGLPAICKAWDVPYGRVLGWLMADAERYAVYCRALEVAAHALVAEAVPLADEAAELIEAGAKPSAVTAKALQVDTRFRVAKHHAAKMYGEAEAGGKVLQNVTIAIGVRVGERAAVIEGDADADI